MLSIIHAIIPGRVVLQATMAREELIHSYAQSLTQNGALQCAFKTKAGGIGSEGATTDPYCCCGI